MSQMKWTDGCDALVDFVEEHGGSMGGETRDHLFNIVQNIIDGQPLETPPPDDFAKYDAELVGHFLDTSRIGESIPGQYAHELARVANAEHSRLASFRRRAVEAILAKPLPRGMTKLGETAFEQGKLEAVDILNTNFPSGGAPVEPVPTLNDSKDLTVEPVPAPKYEMLRGPFTLDGPVPASRLECPDDLTHESMFYFMRSEFPATEYTGEPLFCPRCGTALSPPVGPQE